MLKVFVKSTNLSSMISKQLFNWPQFLIAFFFKNATAPFNASSANWWLSKLKYSTV
jgi:hypothetical protein